MRTVHQRLSLATGFCVAVVAYSPPAACGGQAAASAEPTGHTLNFRQVHPNWGVDSLIQSMKSIHFNANGSDRTYWDFFVGFGLFVTALMLLASIVAWQFASLSVETLAGTRISAWTSFFALPSLRF